MHDFPINDQIKSPSILLVRQGGNIVMVTTEAVKIAREQNMDLVMVDGRGDPPACRIFDYGKFRYEQSKKEREQKRGQKSVESKEITLKLRIAENDLAIKVEKVKGFLREGRHVKITLRFVGREITRPQMGMDLLRHVFDLVKTEAKLIKPPSIEGRRVSIIIAPEQK